MFGGIGAGGEVRHGIVAVRSDTKAKQLLGVVEAALVGTDVAVHVAEEKQVASAAIELLTSAEGRGRGGVLIVSHEKLLRLDHEARSSGQEWPQEGVLWSILSLLIEYDALPEPLLMQARRAAARGHRAGGPLPGSSPSGCWSGRPPMAPCLGLRSLSVPCPPVP